MTTLSFTRNSDSNEMTVATNLAAELVERMQFNRRNLVNGYHGINLASANPALCIQNPLTQPVARGDCLQWQARLFASGLVGVGATVTVVAVGPVTINQNNINVTVTWIGSSRNTIAGGGAAWVAGAKAVTLNTMIAPE
jgi:type IV pilus assembly protein PilV